MYNNNMQQVKVGLTIGSSGPEALNELALANVILPFL